MEHVNAFKWLDILRLITTRNPIGFFLEMTIAARNIRALKKAISIENSPGNLKDMLNDLKMNTRKQGWVLTFSLMIGWWYVSSVGPNEALGNEDLWKLAGGLTVAWFVITFSSVKELFLDSATILTFFMFTAFSAPWVAVIIAEVSSNNVLSEKVLMITIIVFAWSAAAIYDSLDLLRGNMDELAMDFYNQAVKDTLKVKIEK